jgi:hypothetical protein
VSAPRGIAFANVDEPGTGATNADAIAVGSTIRVHTSSGTAFASAGSSFTTDAFYDRADREFLWVLNGDRLYYVDDDTGFFADMGPSGSDSSLAAWGHWLYMVEGDELWMLDDAARPVILSTTWTGADVMTTHGDFLYIFQHGILYRVNVFSGATTVPNVQRYTAPSAIGATSNALYVFDGGTLYELEPQTLNRRWSMVGFTGEVLLATCEDVLYALETSTGKLYRISGGARTTLLQDVLGVTAFAGVPPSTDNRGGLFLVWHGQLLRFDPAFTNEFTILTGAIFTGETRLVGGVRPPRSQFTPSSW